MTNPEIASVNLVQSIQQPGSEKLRPLKFLIAGGLSVPVSMGARMLFSMVVSFDVAVVLAHLCGMVTAYTLNKLFVFEASGREVRSELLRFAIVNMISLCQTWLVSTMLMDHVLPASMKASHAELLAHFLGLASTAVTSYFGHKLFSFSRSQPQT